MKAVIQRVSRGSVSVSNSVIGKIDKGFVILLGICPDDNSKDIQCLADKISGLRIFDDSEGKMNLSALDVGAQILVISQFTLYGDCKKGRRPSFTGAAPPEVAEDLYNEFVEFLKQKDFVVETGTFGARMMVEIVNDGPVTFVLDSKDLMPR